MPNFILSFISMFSSSARTVDFALEQIQKLTTSQQPQHNRLNFGPKCCHLFPGPCSLSSLQVTLVTRNQIIVTPPLKKINASILTMASGVLHAVVPMAPWPHILLTTLLHCGHLGPAVPAGPLMLWGLGTDSLGRTFAWTTLSPDHPVALSASPGLPQTHPR